jgi:hypothetical protein
MKTNLAIFASLVIIFSLATSGCAEDPVGIVQDEQFINDVSLKDAISSSLIRGGKWDSYKDNHGRTFVTYEKVVTDKYYLNSIEDPVKSTFNIYMIADFLWISYCVDGRSKALSSVGKTGLKTVEDSRKLLLWYEQDLLSYFRTVDARNYTEFKNVQYVVDEKVQRHYYSDYIKFQRFDPLSHVKIGDETQVFIDNGYVGGSLISATYIISWLVEDNSSVTFSSGNREFTYKLSNESEVDLRPIEFDENAFYDIIYSL